MSRGYLDDAVLIVIGSVRDRELSGPRYALLEAGKMAKVVRMSTREFLDDFRNVLLEHGIDNLCEIGCYRDLVSWAKAIHSVKGHIGGIVMDSATWRRIVGDIEELFNDRPVWMVHDRDCRRLPAAA